MVAWKRTPPVRLESREPGAPAPAIGERLVTMAMLAAAMHREALDREDAGLTAAERRMLSAGERPDPAREGEGEGDRVA